MNSVLTREQKSDLLNRGFSRRNFGRIAAMITAGAALPFYNEPALAQLSARNIPPDAVKINANENPLGPCAEAAEAIHKIVAQGGRYLYGETDKLQRVCSPSRKASRPATCTPYAGSSAPLHQAVFAFTSPDSPFVTADPGYEAGERAADFIGAKVIRVPLDPNVRARREGHGRRRAQRRPDLPLQPEQSDRHRHPARRYRVAASRTSRRARSFCSTKPTSTSRASRTGSDLVAKDKDVIILRTFSKIYGMAGIRAARRSAVPTCSRRSPATAPARCRSPAWPPPSRASSRRRWSPSAASSSPTSGRRLLLDGQAQFSTCRPSPTSSWST